MVWKFLAENYLVVVALIQLICIGVIIAIVFEINRLRSEIRASLRELGIADTELTPEPPYGSEKWYAWIDAGGKRYTIPRPLQAMISEFFTRTSPETRRYADGGIVSAVRVGHFLADTPSAGEEYLMKHIVPERIRSDRSPGHTVTTRLVHPEPFVEETMKPHDRRQYANWTPGSKAHIHRMIRHRCPDFHPYAAQELAYVLATRKEDKVQSAVDAYPEGSSIRRIYQAFLQRSA